MYGLSVSHRSSYKLRIKPSYNISVSVQQQEQYQSWTFKQVHVKILTIQKNYMMKYNVKSEKTYIVYNHLRITF